MTARYAGAKPLPMKKSELETLMYRILRGPRSYLQMSCVPMALESSQLPR